MPGDIPARPELLIVSDTSIWVGEGGIWAFEPVVREIENFEYLFSKITWIGFKHPYDAKQKNSKLVVSDKVKMVLLPATGGDTILQKLRTVLLFPYFVVVVAREVFSHQYIHTRNPSIPGFIAVFISIFSLQKRFWHKWAGNWISETHPISYRIQKYFIIKPSKAIVSVNGTWPGQPGNIINLENPCYTEAELLSNNNIGSMKNFDDKLKICFVGNLTRSKGIMQFLESMEQIEMDLVSEVMIIGDGILRTEAEAKAARFNSKIKFMGFLNREQLNEIYSAMHIIVLPSLSEGFPKVIAEAMSFGCIPVITDISCIGQYVKNNVNGFLLANNQGTEIASKLNHLLNLQPEERKLISKGALECSNAFTYEKYNQKIKSIFNI